MDTKKNKVYSITAGPNKDSLFDACKYAFENGVKLPIKFTATIDNNINTSIAARIIMIEHEDGSGESFNLRGHCKADLRDFGLGITESCNFKAYYNSKHRNGWIKFE